MFEQLMIGFMTIAEPTNFLAVLERLFRLQQGKPQYSENIV